jgi:hypothetical protein
MDSSAIREHLRVFGLVVDAIEQLQDAVENGSVPEHVNLGKLYDFRQGVHDTCLDVQDAVYEVAGVVNQLVDDIEALWDDETGLDDVLDSFDFD